MCHNKRGGDVLVTTQAHRHTQHGEPEVPPLPTLRLLPLLEAFLLFVEPGGEVDRPHLLRTSRTGHRR
jgi:hypothetical protein